MEKRRFSIITKENGPEYSRETQVQLIFACTALHNFIVENEGLDEAEEEDYNEEEGGWEELAPQSLSEAAKAMNLLRDRIAESMWNAYSIYNLI